MRKSLIGSLTLALSLLCGAAAMAFNFPTLDQIDAMTETEVFGEIAREFEMVMRRQTKPEKDMHRPVFAKAHGCLMGEFIVNLTLPLRFKVGVFKESKYPAIVRFSNDGPPRPDKVASARGMAIKLLGVKGEKILPGEEQAETQDFVMQNYPIFFTDTARDFLKFVASGLSGNKAENEKYNQQHPETQKILDDMDKQVLRDPLDGTYWTPTPYRLGQRAMKYMVEPCQLQPGWDSKPMTEENFLRANLRAHIAKSDGCFKFMVQLQKDSAEMPLDKATVRWEASESSFKHFATLILPKGQLIDGERLERACDQLSMTGWHALPEHTPLGSINHARGWAYKHMADIRRQNNKMPLEEPKTLEQWR